VDEALSEGYILAPYFSEKLTKYEKQPEAMRLFFADMAAGIDIDRESRRLANVKFAEHARVRAAKVERRAESAPPPGNKSLDEADQFYSNKDYEHARHSYLRALEETGDQAAHARAYYGLARVAVLQNNPELGEKLFQKALESTPEPFVKAWAHVYLGRLSDIAGNREEAAKQYQAALAVDGGSAAARRAAEQGLQEAFKKQHN
jgi:tetratricopeptide (TPR) repeat protein